MTTPQFNRTPYLITSRKFPEEIPILINELSKMYFDIAYAVNQREISIYTTTQVDTGQRWFNVGNTVNRQQAFRQVYTVASILNGTTTIPANISTDSNTRFTHIYGIANFPLNFSLPIPYVNVATPGDGIQLRYNWSTGNIEIITTTGNYTSYSAIIVLEYILNN